jgi:hypothetical protein
MHAGGHEMLLKCLEEETLKPAAAKGLAELLKTQPNQLPLIEAGFVNIALSQIVVSSFYDVNIALGLRTLSGISEGLSCMKDNPDSSQALLLLLEHCPDPEGKKAAAKVIEKLFGELEDHTAIIMRCGLLINLVSKQYKEVLEAIEVVTRECRGILAAVEQNLLYVLIPLLQRNSDISIQVRRTFFHNEASEWHFSHSSIQEADKDTRRLWLLSLSILDWQGEGTL